MRTNFDHGANALYVTLTDEPTASTRQLSNSILVDLNENGAPVGIEVLQPKSEWLPPLLETFESAMKRSDVMLLKSLYPSHMVHTSSEVNSSVSEAQIAISSESLEYA